MLADDSWKDDAIPEIMDGKNVADFIDPDIAEKLEALEREEERLEAEGFYNSDGSMVSRHLDAKNLGTNGFPDRLGGRARGSRNEGLKGAPNGLPSQEEAKESTSASSNGGTHNVE